MMIREVSKKNVAPMGTIRSPVPVVCNGLRLFGIKHFFTGNGQRCVERTESARLVIFL